jgi:hypothetical protein
MRECQTAQAKRQETLALSLSAKNRPDVSSSAHLPALCTRAHTLVEAHAPAPLVLFVRRHYIVLAENLL